MSTVSTCLVILALWPPVLQYQLPALLSVCVLFVLFFLFVVVSGAGRPKAALLFWFFGDFRCGALLFTVIHVIYKYKNR